MNRIWILGIGPLMVDKLFVQDVTRLDVYINNILMPKNVYIVLEEIYKLYESDYLFYTKYISQRLGNNAYDNIKKQYENSHIVCNQYNIFVSMDQVEAKMYFSIYDNELKWLKNINVISMIKKYSKSITLVNF